MTKKKIAIALLKMASAGNVREAYARYVHPEFRHHNAYYRGDRQTLLEGMEENARQFPQKGYETLRSLEDGNLVAVHGRVTLAPDKIFSVIHIFRFEGEKRSKNGSPVSRCRAIRRMRTGYSENGMVVKIVISVVAFAGALY